MSTITFDTHKFVRNLKASGINEQQAEAITDAIRDAQDSSDVATKGDLREFRVEINSEMHLLKWMVGFSLAMNMTILVRLFIK